MKKTMRQKFKELRKYDIRKNIYPNFLRYARDEIQNNYYNGIVTVRYDLAYEPVVWLVAYKLIGEGYKCSIRKSYMNLFEIELKIDWRG